MEEAGFINLNLMDVDDGSDPIDAGTHLLRVKSATRKHKEGSQYPYIDVRFNPLDVPGKEKRTLRLTLSFHPDALWNMKRFLKAIRVEIKDKGFHLEDIVGKEIYATVSVNQEQRNEIGPPYSPAA